MTLMQCSLFRSAGVITILHGFTFVLFFSLCKKTTLILQCKDVKSCFPESLNEWGEKKCWFIFNVTEKNCPSVLTLFLMKKTLSNKQYNYVCEKFIRQPMYLKDGTEKVWNQPSMVQILHICNLCMHIPMYTVIRNK